ncbi:MAG TPA: hypothetical protein VLH94_01025 [Spirochaetia bacterium]|nr:hypothetical protein [Spirochaetia bacterium]
MFTAIKKDLVQWKENIHPNTLQSFYKAAVTLGIMALVFVFLGQSIDIYALSILGIVFLVVMNTLNAIINYLEGKNISAIFFIIFGTTWCFLLFRGI